MFKRFVRTTVFRGRLAQLGASLFTLFFITSCAGNGEPLTNPESKSDSPATAAQDYYSYDESPTTTATNVNQGSERRPASATTLNSKGYSFKNPGGDWAMIGGEDGAPYEFYNARTGRRAVLREVT
ncbi:MAG: hypothetical protein IJ977_07795, partial [Fibrobacter sp.]|nr:hypothetical protein [Fibrobacter sp.]